MINRRLFLQSLLQTAAGLYVAEDLLEPHRKIFPVGIDLSALDRIDGILREEYTLAAIRDSVNRQTYLFSYPKGGVCVTGIFPVRLA